ncbi:cytochrome c-552 [Hypericibacter terrae]|jgi:cytochrome c2|uniref:Cytochrome c-552 n=1 Tax=Hypericibacter terrae TaxID=2602015 RepID=A0A5J6MGN9_9PROT|nr:c-type cytochrome [Hypericibacter terrae]QEX16642.1 cytochrome c-552 [Hypericibacter terrae]
MHGSRRARWLATAVFLAVASAASGATAADVANGLQLSRQWCASCHLVEPSGVARDSAPSFASISNDPTTTPERLHAWLADPHPPMPGLDLAKQQEDDIIAYLKSLKTQ